MPDTESQACDYLEIIFLHGPPGSGKLTIAGELKSIFGGVVLHNHLTFDVAKECIGIDAPEFWELCDELRLVCYQFMARHRCGIVVLTMCYDHPHDLAFFRKMEQVFANVRTRLHPVYLECSLPTLEERIISPQRKQQGKIFELTHLHKVLNDWNCVAVPSRECITVQTDGKTPKQCAIEIVLVLKLRDCLN